MLMNGIFSGASGQPRRHLPKISKPKDYLLLLNKAKVFIMFN